ncbi:Hsp70-Hsp90 organizing protein 3-like protein [Drosera capensis]
MTFRLRHLKCNVTQKKMWLSIYSNPFVKAPKTTQTNPTRSLRIHNIEAMLWAQSSLHSLSPSRAYPLLHLHDPTRKPPTPTAAAAHSINNDTNTTEIEIRVCTNRTCRRQGSFAIHETLAGISPPNVSVNACGCLGRCGAGPNLVVLPAGVVISHCGTPAIAAAVLIEMCGGGDGGDERGARCLEALALRKRAEVEIEGGRLAEAEALLSKAIDIKPFGALHIIYKTRCYVRLQKDDLCGALEDAKQALDLAPRYAEAYICQGDVFLGMSLFDEADSSYFTALEIDPSIRRSNSFKARLAKLQEKLASTV